MASASQFRFEVVAQDYASRARVGRLHTPHGIVETPVFMPVGTAGTVKAMTQQMLEDLGVEILLANTYHLFLRPGHELIRELGGLHRFMSWPRAVLTDSGGFQVFSLNTLRKVSDEGVLFRSHLDGSAHFLSPEKVVEIQMALGSDIQMVFDECIEYPASHEHSRRALLRTLDWAHRAKEGFREAQERAESRPHPGQVLFGIVQGGTFADLRREAAERLAEMNFPGYGIGGLAVGEPTPLTMEMTDLVVEQLPPQKPRYLMGVGPPEELADFVRLGIDMMDCVLPTRNARNGCLFTSQGKIIIKNARYARDSRPLDERCGCFVCQRYSRSYLRHLYLADEILSSVLNTYHNLYFYLDIMRQIRHAIREGQLARFAAVVQAAEAE